MNNKILFLALAIFPFSTFAAEAPQRMVSVSGECNHMVTPDRGAITLTVEFQNMDLSKATQEAAESYEKVSAAVKKLNLKDANLQTSEYSVNQIFAWENSKQVNKGFKARMGLRVATSDISKIGEVIAIASKEKVKSVGSLETYMSEAKQLKEEIACLEEASQNARLKAEKLATALNAKLGSVLTVSESGRSMPYWPRPMYDRVMAKSELMAQGAAPAPEVQAGQQNLTLNIQVSFNLQ